MNYDSFQRTWREQVKAMAEAGQLKQLIAGIRLVGDGPDLPRGDAEKSVKLIRSTGGKGHVWWYSRGVLDLYQDDLRSFYNVANRGHAPHPFRSSDWRPPPIALAAVENHPGVWRSSANVPDGNYRLIARFEKAWRELRRVSIHDGVAEVSVDDSPEAVELLVDRRGAWPRKSSTGQPATE